MNKKVKYELKVVHVKYNFIIFNSLKSYLLHTILSI